MRPARRLFPRIIAADNVWAAYREARAGKRRRPDVARFALDEDEHVTRLIDELRTGRWRPGRYALRVISEPKRRLIAAAPFRDRVVHHAVHRVLAPLLEPGFVDTSYACRPGLGTHRAVLAFQRGLARYRYVLRMDVKRYYLEIGWDRLNELLRRRIDDDELHELLDTIIESGEGLYANPAVLQALGLANRYRPHPRKGLPIGNLTSQLFGNFFLDGFDHFLKRELKVPVHIKYMDDVALFGDRRGEMRDWLRACVDWLRRERGLEVAVKGGAPLSTRATYRFLGVTVARGSRQVSRATVRRMQARARKAARAGMSDAESADFGTAIAAAVSSLAF